MVWGMFIFSSNKTRRLMTTDVGRVFAQYPIQVEIAPAVDSIPA
jgi:hypothetical protein